MKALKYGFALGGLLDCSVTACGGGAAAGVGVAQVSAGCGGAAQIEGVAADDGNELKGP